MQKSFSRAQGAIEYLLITGAAIVVVAVVVVAIISVSNSGRSDLGSAPNSIDQLKEASGNYYRISNYYYLKNDVGAGLMGLWHFDDGSAIVADSSGNGNTCTLVNSPSWVDGRFGSALSFSGSNYINCGSGASLLSFTGPITLEAWIYPAGGAGVVLLKGKSGAFWEYGTSAGVNSLSATFTDSDLAASSITLPVNKWSQIVVVYEGAAGNWTVKYYINGVLKDTKTTTWSRYGDGTSVLSMGAVYASSPYSFFNGRIDEVAIWNRALSPSDIQKLYTNSQ